MALLIGVNAGPIVTPWASLATLLWAHQARQQGAQVSWRMFVVGGLVLAPVAVGRALRYWSCSAPDPLSQAGERTDSGGGEHARRSDGKEHYRAADVPEIVLIAEVTGTTVVPLNHPPLILLLHQQWIWISTRSYRTLSPMFPRPRVTSADSDNASDHGRRPRAELLFRPPGAAPLQSTGPLVSPDDRRAGDLTQGTHCQPFRCCRTGHQQAAFPASEDSS